jgi:hypothetical protein
MLLQMLATLAADPIAGLVDTAYVGRLGRPTARLQAGQRPELAAAVLARLATITAGRT